MKIKHYIRYTDDFIFVASKASPLKALISQINLFLKNNLKLTLHLNKIIIRKLKQGIDFLGYVILPHYRILRTRTKRRILKRVNQKNLPSYLGQLKHCKGYKLQKKLERLSILE